MMKPMPDLKLVVVCGLPGCGKSTIAACISKEFKFPIFSVDPIESGMLKSGLKRSLETGLAAYNIAEVLAEEHLKLNQSAIVDAVSGVQEAKEMWRGLAAKYSAALVIVECICPDPALQRHRIESRTRDIYGIPEITWDRVEAYRNEYVAWQEPKLVLDAADTVEANVTRAFEYIKLA